MWFAILLRFLIPLIIIYYVVRFIASLVRPKKNFENDEKKEPLKGKDSDPVIDVCTKCGEIKTKFHRCRK